MRLFAIILALFLAGAAWADDWKEYDNPEYSFAIHFPVEPTVESTTYRAGDGRAFDARVFSVTRATGTFKVTIAEMPDDATGEALVRDAFRPVAEGGAIKFDIGHRVRAVYGRQLGVSDGNGGYSYVALFYHKKRLYHVEGKAFVAGGQAEVDAMRFQQSLDFT